jgi:hypothetical protein
MMLVMAPSSLAQAQQENRPKADPRAVRGPVAEPDTFEGRTTTVCLSRLPGEKGKQVPCPPQALKEKPANYGKPTLYPAIPS